MLHNFSSYRSRVRVIRRLRKTYPHVFADEVRSLGSNLLFKDLNVLSELDFGVGNPLKIDSIFRVGEKRLEKEVAVAKQTCGKETIAI